MKRRINWTLRLLNWTDSLKILQPKCAVICIGIGSGLNLGHLKFTMLFSVHPEECEQEFYCSCYEERVPWYDGSCCLTIALVFLLSFSAFLVLLFTLALFLLLSHIIITIWLQLSYYLLILTFLFSLFPILSVLCSYSCRHTYKFF